MITGRLPALLLATMVIIATPASHGPSAQVRDADSADIPRSIIILAVDTLRADRLGCYGSDANLTPNMDALAAESVVFERHMAPASWSLPCYASLFTGAAPSRHGVLDNNQYLSDEFHTLAELLQLYGYRTAGFVGGSHLTSIFNLNQGFETWQDQPNFGSFFHSVPRAVEFIDGLDPTEPFMLMVQGYDCHTPYYEPLGLGDHLDPGYTGPVHDLDLLSFEKLHLIRDGQFFPRRKVPVASHARNMPIDTPHVALAPEDIRHIRAHYDGAVAYSDLWIGLFLDHLRAIDRYDESLIVLLGDHGEDLMEHGYFFHRNALYRQNIHTPLIIKFPSEHHRGRRVPEAVSTIDIFPTLLSIFGITEPADQVDGLDLGHLLQADSPTESRPVFSTLTDQESIVSGRWHLIRRTGENRRYDPGIELYDLDSDPAETINLAKREPKTARRLEALLDEWRATQPKPSSGGTVRLDALLEKTLKEAGYWEADP